MADPTTSNTLLAVPTRGSDVGTWDLPVNANSTAIDGYFGGVVTISASNVPITLTAPAGVVTPTAGPFQSQNKILKFTGTLTGNVQVTLPLPGEYTIQNLTTGAFVLSFKAGAGNIVATPQGSIMGIWNDGTDVWLLKNQMPGALTFLGGIIAVPAWITACTIKPYLLSDGTVYTFAVYPALAGLYLGNFGGNGTTTFAVQDLRGRMPLAYDGTGTRVTVAKCGLNGQTMGASLDTQNLTLAQLPTGITVNGTVTVTSNGPNVIGQNNTSTMVDQGSFPGAASRAFGGSTATAASVTSSGSNTLTSNNTSGTATPIIPPTQVSGIWLVAT